MWDESRRRRGKTDGRKLVARMKSDMSKMVVLRVVVVARTITAAVGGVTRHFLQTLRRL